MCLYEGYIIACHLRILSMEDYIITVEMIIFTDTSSLSLKLVSTRFSKFK